MKQVSLVGPLLSSLTPDQIEDLLTTAGYDLAKIATCEDVNKRASASLHPRLWVNYRQGSTSGHERPHLAFKEWEEGGGESPEADMYSCEIYAGEVVGHYGISLAVLPVVHWFLSHGWRWEVEPGVDRLPADVRAVIEIMAKDLGAEPDSEVVWISARLLEVIRERGLFDRDFKRACHELCRIAGEEIKCGDKTVFISYRKTARGVQYVLGHYVEHQHP